jgi:hypothetical protein
MAQNTVAVNNNASFNSQSVDFGGFVKPPMRLGKLVPLPGSTADIAIKLEKRLTTFGRDPRSDYPYDPMDVRVPKCPIDILFWRPGIEAEMENGANWLEMKDIWALIVSRSGGITINDGEKLQKAEDGCWKYGKLRHGDIITVFDHPKAFLKYRCEFYHGLSQSPRAVGEPFEVEVEAERYMAAKSRNGSGSEAGSTSSST